MGTAPLESPGNLRRLPGSFRRPPSHARWLGPADPQERLSVTLRLSQEHDRKQLGDFASCYGLRLIEVDATKRSAILRGRAQQMSRAFGIALSYYSSTGDEYRGRDGYIHVPAELEGTIQGVFGLDTQPVGGRNGDGIFGTALLTPGDIARLYDFPPGQSAAGQTIGVIEFGGGYLRSDIEHFFSSLAAKAPAIVEVNIDGASNNPGWSSPKDREVLMDICLAAAVAPGATIAVYFAPQTQKGWVDAIQRAVHPGPGDPVPSVISISWYLSNGDDAGSLRDCGVTPDTVDAISSAFFDAAARGESGPTVFVASGDLGADSGIDGKARVQYPASDPWVTACGGTRIAKTGSSFEEFAWPLSGGGVSAHFALPAYQTGAGVPMSVNDGRPGRGVPDIAGNASPASGYRMELKGAPFVAAKTSAVAPLYAGLTALMNASLGRQVGFLNPLLYALGAGSHVFRDINDGTMNGAPGYQCGPGWDACTGFGSLRGSALLGELRRGKPSREHR